eukprot:PLAT8871.1.p1 GENE.PLAT8871.1~~PLAT8871.1.p1  ORF type:complete len:212 (-),score=34.43 PLAT8871.1:339-911(-)
MMKTFAAVMCLLAIATPLVSAHAILVVPRPRPTDGLTSGGGLGVKIPFAANPSRPTEQEMNSCGNSPRGPVTIAWEQGSAITIAWKMTLPHASSPGVRVAINDGSGFVPLQLLEGQTSADGFFPAFDGTAGTTDSIYATKVVLPENLSCLRCELQWVWASTQDGGWYRGCVDVQVQTPAQVARAAQLLGN